MKLRLCNSYDCAGTMRPTREVKLNHRIFKCAICGKENPWVSNPKLDGSFGELHKTQDGDMSGLSLLSDPIFYPTKSPRPVRPKR